MWGSHSYADVDESSFALILSPSPLPLLLVADALTDADQVELQRIMAELDMKQTTRMFQAVTSLAFKECVTSFRGRHLEKSETKCIESMVGKYLAHFQRINTRFAEEYAERTRQQQAEMAQAQGQAQ